MNADRREGSGGTADKWRLSLCRRAGSTAVRCGVYPELAAQVDNNDYSNRSSYLENNFGGI